MGQWNGFRRAAGRLLIVYAHLPGEAASVRRAREHVNERFRASPAAAERSPLGRTLGGKAEQPLRQSGYRLRGEGDHETLVGGRDFAPVIRVGADTTRDRPVLRLRLACERSVPAEGEVPVGHVDDSAADPVDALGSHRKDGAVNEHTPNSCTTRLAELGCSVVGDRGNHDR